MTSTPAAPTVVRVTLFLIGYMLVLLGTSVFKGMSPPGYADLVWGITASLALVALTRLFLRREQKTFADVAMRPHRHTATRLLVALVAGVALYLLTLAIISVAAGPLQHSAPAWPSASRWLVVVASYLALASMEELGFRAYALRTLVPAIGRWKAQLLIAVAFGLTHIAFGWPWTRVVMGVIPSGLLFGALALRRGGLALAIGVHAALNLAQWIVGEKETPGVWTLTVDPAHTARLAGTAPLIATAVVLVAAALVWWWPPFRAPRLRQP